jgi:hypothetical protein
MEGLTCPECHLTFARKYVMLRHKRNKHGKTQPYPQKKESISPPPPPQKEIIPPSQMTTDIFVVSTFRSFPRS